MDKQIKIDFLASAKGLDSIYEKIKEIKNMKGIQIGTGLQKQFSQLDAMVPALQQRLQALSSKQDLNLIDVEQVDRDFQQITRGFQKALKELSSSLPREVSANLEKAKQAIADIDKQIKSSKGKISTRENKLITDKSGKTTLTDAEANKVFNQQKAPVIKDNEIASFEQYKQKFEELRKTQQLSKEEEKQISAAIQQTEAAIKQKTNVLQTEIAAEQKKIAAYQQDRDQAVINKQNVEEQIRNNQQLTQQQQALTNSVINASNQVSNAEAKQAQASETATRALKEEEKALQQKKLSTSAATSVTEANTKAQQTNNNTVVKAAKQVFSYGTVLMLFRRIYSTVTSTIKEMDKALTGMAVVTNMSREQTWELVGSFQELANQTGKTTTEIANMATKFFQQGKSLTQVKQLTEAAAKAATIAGIDGSQSIDLLTNAMNGFQMSASKAMEVSDKFAALAASAATDYEELATALSKVAAQANLAGMSMDFTLGLLTKGIEVTREAPETIGTALKTVIARMRELTDYGKTLEDGIDVNRVAKALSNIGVDLMDVNGQFRDLELVLTEVGKKWDTLNKNQQANVAVALAGTRQQSRLIAMMQDFDRTLELVDISANSYGATLSQSSKYMGGLEAAGARLKTSIEGLVTAVTSSEAIITVIGAIGGLVNTISWIVDQSWLMIPVLILIGGHLLHSVDMKLRELNYTRAIRTEELKKSKIKKQQRLIEIKNRKEVLQTLISELKTGDATKKTLKNKLKIAKVQAEQENNLALVAAYEAQINSLKADDFSQAKMLSDAEAELVRLGAEEYLLTAQIAADDAKILASQQAIGGATGVVVKGLGGWLSILSIIPTLLLTILGLSSKIGEQTKLNTILEKLHFKQLLKSAGAAMAKSVAGIPVWGWIVAGAILATLAGISIAMGVKTQSGEKADDSIAETKEELNQLQADLYNLNSAKQNVAKLGDEFENLSSKIVQSSEDIERMNEIAQQINDTAGRAVVDTTANVETQLRQIRAYNMQQDAAVQTKTEDINDELGQGFKDAQKGWFKNKKSKKNARDKYYKSLKTDSAFINSIRTVGMANLTDMDSVSAATSDAMLDIMVDNIDSGAYFSEEGIDTGKFEQYITDALASSGYSGGYSAFLAQLDSVAEDGSMTAYANMLDDLGKSGDENFKKLMDSLKKSNSMFAAVAKMGTETARKFDAIGFSSDDLNVMWEKLGQSSKALGKDAGETFAEMAKNIETMGDTDGDGIVSDLEARQAMYKQLVAEQLNAAKASQAIVDGTDKTSEAAKKYNQNLTDLTTKQQEIINKQKEIDKANDKSNPNEDKIEKLEADMDNLTGQAAEIESEIKAVEDAAANCYVNIEELSTILGIVSTKEITEEFTKLASAMERVAKISDIASMSLEEQMNLLADYPELLSAMERGYLTASEGAQLYGDTIAQAQDNIAANKSNYKLKYSEDGGLKLNTSEMTGFEQLFDNTEEGRDQREDFKAMGQISMDDLWVANMWGYGLPDDQLTEAQKAIRSKFTSPNDFITYLGNVQADVQEMSNLNFIEGKLAEGDYSVIMSKEQKEMWAAATDYAQQHRNALEGLNEELEYLDINSAEYLDALRERNDLITTTLKDGADRLVKIKEETDDTLRVKSEDENYGWLLQYTGGDDSLSELVKFENGVAQINYEILNSLNLTEEQRNAMLAYISTSISHLNELAEEEKDINDQRREDAEALAQSMIDSEAKVLEAQIESLEKRKEAYEEYFDKIDALEEEEERTATMNDIAKQLSALAGGSDAATNSLRKDLMSQMDDLRKEEEEARKEAAREALIESIDDQIENTNEKLDTLNDSINKVVQAILATSANGVKVTTDGNGRVQLELDGKIWKPYANGGLVDYTGPAMVHGSPQSPEAFLSAQDTKNMQMLFAALNEVMAKSTVVNASSDINNISSVIVENINITTNELNNDQDFKTAGQIFAEEFGKAIKQRGLNINVRK